VRHALLSLPLAATLAAAAIDLPAAETGNLLDCLNRLDARDPPIAAIYESCPDLDERIAATGWSASLPLRWPDRSGYPRPFRRQSEAGRVPARAAPAFRAMS